MTKISSGEVAKITEYCTSQKQEIEADIVSARSAFLPTQPASMLTDYFHRLLAHAGFDPQHAVCFWEGRQETPKTAECSPARAEELYQEQEVLPRRWMGSTHPVNNVRVERLKKELVRWEEARRRAREQRRKEREQDG